jgi:DNA polymerase-3 subunit chi
LDVVFYHLTETTLEEALPPLVEKSLERGWRVAIQTGSEERRDALDARLWTYSDDSFIPHGTDRDAHAAEQPVLLTTATENINNAVIRFLVDGAEPGELTGYERAGFLFDGHDMTQVEAAREHWKVMRAAGHSVTYWQQGPDRRWVKKA